MGEIESVAARAQARPERAAVEHDLPDQLRRADIVVVHDREGRRCALPASLAGVVRPRAAHRDLLGPIHPHDRVMLARATSRAIAEPGVVHSTEVRAQMNATWYHARYDVVSWLDRPEEGVVLVGITRTSEPIDRPGTSRVTEIGAPTAWTLLSISELGEVIDVDGMVEEIYGRTAEELIGTTGLDLVHPDHHEALMASWVDVIDEGNPGHAFRQRVLHADGHWTWVLSSIGRMARQPHVVVHDVDITAQLDAEAALRASEERFRLLGEEVPAAVFVTDVEGRLDFANERFTAMTGMSAGDGLMELLDDEQRARWRHVVAHPSESAHGFEVLAMREGRRFLVRGRAPQLDGTIVGAVEDVTATHELQQRARHDPLTGLLGRDALLDEIRRRAERDEPRTLVAFIDLDGFKEVNDTLGHAAGDRVLVSAAQTLRSLVRPGDVVGRWGGDEFVAVVDGTIDHFGQILATRADVVLREVGEGSVHLAGASVGTTEVRSGDVPERVVARADASMYEVKRQKG